MADYTVQEMHDVLITKQATAFHLDKSISTTRQARQSLAALGTPLVQHWARHLMQHWARRLMQHSVAWFNTLLVITW